VQGTGIVLGRAGPHGVFGLGLPLLHSVETIGFDYGHATAASQWLARPMPSVPEFEVLIPSFGASHNLSGDAISMIHDF
jgi:hypothetical protein